jgi:YkgG family uncharacterized protein
MSTLLPNDEFGRPAPDEQVARTVAALEAHGIHAIVLESGEEARGCVLELIPAGADVHNPPSRTLEQIGLAAEMERSTSFHASRPLLHSMDRRTQQREIRRLISSPDVVVGSVHAITEQGQVLVASASGSQLAAEVFGAGSVIWVVGTQKLVRTLEDGFRRIREYSHPLEDERTQQVYGRPSAINKVLVVNGEMPGRITVVLVKEKLGF